ncbi:MAG TPA: class I SAM-dependent methyltransferase, partial [Casimicrobiaceae bacterium]|nr:class I SAM-dependent methyltransferase [Casimicrobiaceae bacterium]
MRTNPIGHITRWLRRSVPAAQAPAAQAGPQALPQPASQDGPTVAGQMERRLAAEPWYVDRLSIAGSRLTVEGWSMPIPGASEPADGWFTINGGRFDAIRYPLPRADVGEVFWMREAAAMSGFVATIEDCPQPYPGGVLEIRRVVADTPTAERGRDSWFKPDPALHADLPDEERRFRVIGDRDADGFLVSGATDYHRIDRAMLAVAGRRLAGFDRVLDWGVGCGRIARHFPAARAQALTGCDIDADNVAWCAGHLPGRFAHCEIAPPLPFPDASFDAIYGISVFTHLREPMQLRWLAELVRVAAQGALIAATIHGRTAIDFSRLPPAEHRRLVDEVRRRGIVFNGANAQLDGHADHRGEYVNVL